jgi:hypothetical protein
VLALAVELEPEETMSLEEAISRGGAVVRQIQECTEQLAAALLGDGEYGRSMRAGRSPGARSVSARRRPRGIEHTPSAWLDRPLYDGRDGSWPNGRAARSMLPSDSERVTAKLAP